MNVTRLILAELADDPDALAGLRALLAAEPDRPALLTPADVAERLGVSTRTVNRWATEGRLPAVKYGRGWRFDPQRLDLAPAARRQLGPAPAGRARRAGDSIGAQAILDVARRAA